MRKAKVYVNNVLAGSLIEKDFSSGYLFHYEENYRGEPVSLTLPLTQTNYEFASFPPFFDGLLPEGSQLQALLKQEKLDSTDYFGQLVTVGNDLVGAVTVFEQK
jgi:serine/threonine-protein kinase HipA